MLDTYYFSAITLTTVGHGDLAPSPAAGKLFNVFYIFGEPGIVGRLLTVVARVSVKWSSQTSGLLKRRPQRPERREAEGRTHHVEGD